MQQKLLFAEQEDYTLEYFGKITKKKDTLYRVIFHDAIRWYYNWNLHREDGPAVEWKAGKKEWWMYGRLHREDGPAIYNNGMKEWYFHGHRHRDNGPAVEWPNGQKFWWIHGRLVEPF